MRVTQHSGRISKATGKAFGAKHNDRAFDVRLSDNIDPTKAGQNVMWACYEGMTFEAAEERYYNEIFGEKLQRTNERYVQQRHPERCRTMDEYRKSRQHCPEELILQIGKIEGHVDAEMLRACLSDYFGALGPYMVQDPGHPGVGMQVLDYAIHNDEAVPHVHIRRVWQYVGKDGLPETGQEKALERLGFDPPDPTQEIGRRNNRKMAFDAMMRERWIEICRDHGLEIESEPVQDAVRGLSKEQWLHGKIAAQQEQIRDQETEIGNQQRQISEKQQEIKRLEVKQLEASVRVGAIVDELKERKEAGIRDIERELADLRAQIEPSEVPVRARKVHKGVPWVEIQEKDFESLKTLAGAYQGYETTLSKGQDKIKRANEIIENDGRKSVRKELAQMELKERAERAEKELERYKQCFSPKELDARERELGFAVELSFHPAQDKQNQRRGHSRGPSL